MTYRHIALKILIPILFFFPFLLVSFPNQQVESQEVEKTSKEARPASLSGFSDEGTFQIYVSEEPIATISFQWQRSL